MRDIYIKTGSSLLFVCLTTANAWAETYGFPSAAPTVPVTATPSVAPSATVPPPATAPATAPQVSRATFTSGIAGREPVDQLTQINAGQQVYYFTELIGLQGHVITHKWERDGTFQLGLQFPVGSSPWRVNSSKNISPNLPGTWTVTVQNDDGSVLRSDTLIVNPVQPVIPPPAQPLTSIPPALQRQPATRPADMPTTDNQTTNTSATLDDTADQNKPVDSETNTGKPIWETLSR